MNRLMESPMYRWGMAALAGVVALAIGVSGAGRTAGAATGSTKGSAQTSVYAPGTDPAMLAAQERASAAAFAGIYNDNQGAGAPGQQAASPDATCPILPCFTDVPPGHPFYDAANRIFMDNLISGYGCGGPGEPCDSENRPYYRPNVAVNRGQMSKFVDNARHMAGINIPSGGVPIYAVSDSPNGGGVVGYGSVSDAAGIVGVGNANGLSRNIEDLNAGVYALSTGNQDSIAAIMQSTHDNGAWIAANDGIHSALYIVDQKGGFSVGLNVDTPTNDSFIGGDLTIYGNCTGCVLAGIMQNTGTSDLRPGDVASMAAAVDSPSEMSGTPMVGVDRAQGAYSTAVVGVVAEKWVLPDLNAPVGTKLRTGYADAEATVIKPGEYMTVATSGAFRTVKVSAANGPIKVGDLLVASDTAGVAMKADPKEAGFGSVIGKAMGNLDSGEGTISVMLTLR